MVCPRTYISKIENGALTPTLTQMFRLSKALQVDVTAILRLCETDLTDPFIVDIAPYLPQLDETQRSVILNSIRELISAK